EGRPKKTNGLGRRRGSVFPRVTRSASLSTSAINNLKLKIITGGLVDLCGIAGMANRDSRPVDETVLRRMCDAMVHRGPDSAGYYLNSCSEAASTIGGRGPASAGLGIRRLAVIDLLTGDQPIHNEDRTVWVVLNGEIYNYQELRAELQKLGHSFYTLTDTEVIVHAYEEYGCDAPKRLRGMFAFA